MSNRAVVERIFAAWQRAPDLRLGQLIDNATDQERRADGGEYVDLFGVENEKLVQIIERSTAPVGSRCGSPETPHRDAFVCAEDVTHEGDHQAGATRWHR